jgi:hypothetical protein
MLSTVQLRQILNDDALTRGLADPEARILVEWLVAQAEKLAERLTSPPALAAALNGLCRRARSLNRFVRLWCHENAAAAAYQLAATERFAWPLPTAVTDPCELMDEILMYEAERLQVAA